MTTVLVIGGSGQLGAPVVRQLLKDGFKVRVLVRNAWPEADYDRVEHRGTARVAKVAAEVGGRRLKRGGRYLEVS